MLILLDALVLCVCDSSRKKSIPKKEIMSTCWSISCDLYVQAGTYDRQFIYRWWEIPRKKRINEYWVARKPQDHLV
jgi:hypothetical protein